MGLRGGELLCGERGRWSRAVGVFRLGVDADLDEELDQLKVATQKLDGSLEDIQSITQKIDEGHPHYVNEGWNKLRIVAQGPRLQTWVNGHLIEDVVNERMHQIMSRSFADVLALSKKHGVTMRTAAYMVGIDRVASAHRLRGIYA